MVEWTNTDKEYYLGLAKHYLPEGYVIVPIEPTEAMIDAAIANGAEGDQDMIRSYVAGDYKAMINEAQK